MTDINFAKAKQLCTAAEMEIVNASKTPALRKLTEKELKAHITQARKLRDKWRDVSTTQRRKTQQEQRSRTTDKNERSQEKADLFGAVLARFESRLEHVSQSEATTANGASRKSPTKKERTVGHREERAATRKKLKEERPEPAAAGNASPPPETTTRTSTAAETRTESGTPAVKTTDNGGAAQPAASRPKSRASLMSKGVKRYGELAEKQQAARTAAKQARIQASGLTTRTRGHVSARGKRAQARRDAK
jgi:hypothetical protein